jgi:hypothetical protein
MTSTSKNSVVSGIKLYLFPSLVTILAMMIWRDVTELRSDVKALLAQSSIDKTKIEQLEKEVRFLQQSVFGVKSTHTTYTPEIYHDKFFKHEEFFDETKYLTKNN